MKGKFLFILIAVSFLFIIIGKANAQDYVLKAKGHTGTYSFAPFNGQISFSGKCVYPHKAGVPKDIPIYLQRLVGGNWKTVAHSSIKGGNKALIKHFVHEYGKKRLGSSYRFLIKNTNSNTVKVILSIMGNAQPQQVNVQHHHHYHQNSKKPKPTPLSVLKSAGVDAVAGGIKGSLFGPVGTEFGALEGAVEGAIVGGLVELATGWWDE
jgi:hypothetical protein